jgi:hypothetical protein
MTRAHGFTALRHLFLMAVAACGGATTAGPVEPAKGEGDSGTTNTGTDAGLSDAGIDRSGFPADVCDGTPTFAPLLHVTPKDAVDYLEVRSQMEFGEADGTLPQAVAAAKQGTPCKTAANASACQSALASLRSAVGWKLPAEGMVPPSRRYLVYTRGDQVAAVTSLDDLAAFIAPVDSPYEAAFLATERGHRIHCGQTNARPAAGGFEIITETGIACGEGTGVDEHIVAVSTTGGFEVKLTVRIKEGDPQCAIGRRPEGFVAHGSDAEDAVGKYFAEIAELEAASITAFYRLAQELEHHGAPAELITRARVSARDEIRHTAHMTALAERFGAIPNAPALSQGPVRDLFAIALENAVEGCVRETFGALQATYQAAHAADPAIRRVMERVARDETSHAALAWAIAAWVEPLFSVDERWTIEMARLRAVEELARDLRTEPDPEVRRLAGTPSAADSAQLLDAVAHELWAA